MCVCVFVCMCIYIYKNGYSYYCKPFLFSTYYILHSICADCNVFLFYNQKQHLSQCYWSSRGALRIYVTTDTLF